jgi:hypothetical protein
MTVLGQQTVAELRDLLAAKDYTVRQIEQAYAEFAPSWSSRDAAAATQWKADWTAFRKRYDVARAGAQHAIDFAKLTPVSDSLLPADSEFQAVLRALKQVDGTITKGDLQDLYSRISSAGKAPDVSQTPQPTAPDADLRAYKAADTAVKTVEQAERAVAKSAESALSPKVVVFGLLGLGLVLGVAAAARRVLP